LHAQPAFVSLRSAAELLVSQGRTDTAEIDRVLGLNPDRAPAPET
jgi:hypothetical protein